MDKAVFDTGLAIRRDVLGADYVDKALAAADDFNQPMQELVTEYCWRRSFAAATIFMAEVIFCVDLTLLIRILRSWRLGMAGLVFRTDG